MIGASVNLYQLNEKKKMGNPTYFSFCVNVITLVCNTFFFIYTTKDDTLATLIHAKY